MNGFEPPGHEWFIINSCDPGSQSGTGVSFEEAVVATGLEWIDLSLG